MGGAFSVNETNVLVKAIETVSTNIINKSISSTGQSVIIKFNSDQGINFSNNEITQTATISSTELLKALSTQQAQQDIAAQVSQDAQSLVKGINTGSIAVAVNILNLAFVSTLDVSSNINNYCGSSINQNITLDFTTKNGNIVADNNNFSQIGSIFSSCILDALTSQDAYQKLQADLEQSAAATASGISVADLIILLVVVIIIIFLPGIAVVYGASKNVGVFFLILSIVILIVGIGFLVAYWGSSTTVMSNTEFSTGLDAGGCQPSGNYVPAASYGSPTDVSVGCFTDSKCQGYDWIPTSGTTGGTSTFYSKVGNTSCDTNSSPQTIANPVLYAEAFYGTTSPSNSFGKSGDIYINTTTGDYWLKPNNIAWNTTATSNLYRDYPQIKSGVTISVVDGGSCVTFPNGYIIQYGVQFASFGIFFKDASSCSNVLDSNGIPIAITTTVVANAPPNNTQEWSGIKINQKKTRYLYIGLGLSISGLLGVFISAYMIYSGKSSSSGTGTPTKTGVPSPPKVEIPNVSRGSFPEPVLNK